MAGHLLGAHPATVSGPAVILFPCSVNRLCCGLAGIIAVKGEAGRESVMDLSRLAALSTRWMAPG
jgi:glucosamine--fructose-6-phosphate aminotransferase (isomerizing)